MIPITRKIGSLLDPTSPSSPSSSSNPSPPKTSKMHQPSPLGHPVATSDHDEGSSATSDEESPKLSKVKSNSSKTPAFLSKMLGPLSHLQFSKSTHSKTASSGDVFGLLKALAADQADSDTSADLAGLSSPSSLTASDALETPSDIAADHQIGGADKGGRKDVPGGDRDSVQTQQQHDLLAAELAALSVSNMSPLAFSDHHEKDLRDTEGETSQAASNRLERTKLRDPFLEDIQQPSDEEKLKAINEEFGDIAGLMTGPEGAEEQEKILADAKGSLFREVMLIGHIHLTTHRLFFHALLPPVPPDSIDDTGAANSAPGTTRSVLLMSGPVTYHHSSPLKPARRVWMEIGPEMISTYPAGDESGRVRPLRVILLNSVRKFEPLHPGEPCDLYLTYTSPHGESVAHFTVDTEQSALQWRRALEGALFHNAKRAFFDSSKDQRDKDTWMMMRCCVPLDRINIQNISDYHSFATLIEMFIDWDDHYRSRFISEQLTMGDPFRQDSVTPVSKNNSPRRSFSDTGAPPNRSQTVPLSATKSADHEKPVRSSTTLLSSVLGRSASNSRSQSPQRSPTPTSNISRSDDGPQWMNTTIPTVISRFNQRTQGESSAGPVEIGPQSHEFRLALLNENAWFADLFIQAVRAAHKRQYKPDVSPAKMRIEVGGHDCLATDEDIEAAMGHHEKVSEDSWDIDDLQPGSVNKVRKAEVIAMAAKVFGFHSDTPVWIKRCYLAGVMPARGHLLITKDFVCFWRRATLGEDIKFRFAVADVKGAKIHEDKGSAFHILSLEVEGRPDVHFEFWRKKSRDEAIDHIQKVTAKAASNDLGIEKTISPADETPSSPEDLFPMGDKPTKEFPSKQDIKHPADILALPKASTTVSREFPDNALPYLPFIANFPRNHRYKLAARHFVLLTIGSRGDVQPYIALGLRLKQDGHRVTIVTHDEFKKWIEGYGIDHRQAGGDPTALMKLSAEHKMFSPGFFKESLGSFRQWLDDLLIDSWGACHDADVLIESPSTMSGIHIAEALGIPYFRAFTMPWTRTNAYPQAFMVPAFEMGPSFNYSTYVLFDNIMWRASAGQINRWRKNHLRLKATDMSMLSTSQVPFLYNFSPAVVPKPLDWHDNISITGYWFLEDSDTDWSPPAALEAFIAKAKEDKKALVYIGFGSIVVPDPDRITKSIIKAVEKADVRAIIAKGWSSRGASPSEEGKDIQFPASCYGLDKVPHGWLFPKVNAALHHGGAGTVGASLRAGLPTIIKPWFGDQFFWALRVTKLGAGLKLGSLRSDDIAAALTEATTNQVMIEKAARVGQRIRSEDGVENALEAISFNISRAAEDRRQMHWQK